MPRMHESVSVLKLLNDALLILSLHKGIQEYPTDRLAAAKREIWNITPEKYKI